MAKDHPPYPARFLIFLVGSLFHSPFLVGESRVPFGGSKAPFSGSSFFFSLYWGRGPFPHRTLCFFFSSLGMGAHPPAGFRRFTYVLSPCFFSSFPLAIPRKSKCRSFPIGPLRFGFYPRTGPAKGFFFLLVFSGRNTAGSTFLKFFPTTMAGPPF